MSQQSEGGSHQPVKFVFLHFFFVQKEIDPSASKAFILSHMTAASPTRREFAGGKTTAVTGRRRPQIYTWFLVLARLRLALFP